MDGPAKEHAVSRSNQHDPDAWTLLDHGTDTLGDSVPPHNKSWFDRESKSDISVGKRIVADGDH